MFCNGRRHLQCCGGVVLLSDAAKLKLVAIFFSDEDVLSAQVPILKCLVFTSSLHLSVFVECVFKVSDFKKLNFCVYL